MAYHQDVDSFYKQWPSITTRQLVATGNGTSGPYTFTIPNTPFLRTTGIPVPGFGVPPPSIPLPLPTIGVQQNVLIEAPDGENVTIAQDNGQGGFCLPATNTSTIDDLTGAVSLDFGSNIAAGVDIYAQTIQYVVSRPTSILFFANQFIVRPVPDTAYFIELKAYRKPTVLLSTTPTQSPELQEWWELLSFGAAMKIFADNADFEQMSAFRPYYEEQLLLMQRRTLKQYQNQRASTIFSPAGTGIAYPNNYPNI